MRLFHLEAFVAASGAMFSRPTGIANGIMARRARTALTRAPSNAGSGRWCSLRPCAGRAWASLIPEARFNPELPSVLVDLDQRRIGPTRRNARKKHSNAVVQIDSNLQITRICNLYILSDRRANAARDYAVEVLRPSVRSRSRPACHIRTWSRYECPARGHLMEKCTGTLMTIVPAMFGGGAGTGCARWIMARLS